MTTASERVAEINREDKARAEAEGYVHLALVEDPAHWARYNIHTGDQVDHYLAVQAHYNGYKDIHGIRPRWVDYDRMTTAEIEEMTRQLYETGY